MCEVVKAWDIFNVRESEREEEMRRNDLHTVHEGNILRDLIEFSNIFIFV